MKRFPFTCTVPLVVAVYLASAALSAQSEGTAAAERASRSDNVSPEGHRPVYRVPIGKTDDSMLAESGSGGPNELQNFSSGGDLIDAAVTALERHNSISVKMRHRVELFGQSMVGTGLYLQLGQGEDRLTRLEISMPLSDSTIRRQQVVDGRFLWIHSQSPKATKVGRVDLRRLRQAPRTAADSPSPDRPASQVLTNISRFGLPGMLKGIRAWFDLRDVEVRSAGSRRVFVTQGPWQPPPPRADNAKTPRENMQGQGGAAGQGGERSGPHTPDHVIVVVGCDDLFPYSVTFLKNQADPSKSSIPHHPIMTVELLSVQTGKVIDPLTFVFKPGDADVVDLTEEHIKKQGR